MLAGIMLAVATLNLSCKRISDADKKAIIKEYLENAPKDNPITSRELYCNPCEVDSTEIAKITQKYLLDTTLLVKMTENYNTALLKSNSEDSRCIWFDITRLKEFIAIIENTTCGKKCDKNPVNYGIRMYYGRYPNPQDKAFPQLNMLPQEYENHHTVFMVPTFDDGNGNHIDFDPRDGFSVEKCLPTMMDGSHINAFGISVNDNQALNHGDLIPPPYNVDYHRMGAYFLR